MIAEPALPKVDRIEPAAFDDGFLNDPAAWLGQQAVERLGTGGPLHVLAYADDGVIWGIVEQQRLHLLQGGRAPSFRSATLQQCRVFGAHGELMVWREAEGRWRGRIIVENGGPHETLDEGQMLWGVAGAVAPANNAVQLAEPGLGFQQTVPAPPGRWRAGGRVYLVLRHYLAPDKIDGQAVIAHTRLLNLTWEAGDAATA